MRIRFWKIVLAAFVFAMALVLVRQPVNAQGQVHVVQRGETLWSIAVRYGTTTQALVRANGLANANHIYAGQRLTITSGGSSTAPATSSGTYVVRRGDTLFSIARRHGTTVQALVQANNLRSSNIIYVGQRLRLASGGSNPPPPSSSGGASVTYTVRRGDTLAAIAVLHGTTVWAIAHANGMTNPNLVYVGQHLRLPASGSTGSTSGSPSSPPAGSGKRIVVDLSDQRMYVYQNGQLLWNWVVSTGRPGQETAVGHWKVLNKLPTAYAYTWGLTMPNWLGIYWAGRLQNGIHALPIQANGQTLWAGYLGRKVSYGCVILSTENARTLYNWAPVGTPVDVVW